MAPTTTITPSAIPLPYTLFFLYIEPFFTALGAVYAFFLQHQYLTLTVPSNPLPPSLREQVVLNQLANLYLVFAVSEACVLRATKDVRVWKIFLVGLLIADFGHLASVWQVMGAGRGGAGYWEVWNYSKMDHGNLSFVYVGAMTRACFLLGIGLGGGTKRKTSRSK
ncbi:hypothetical protein LTR95_002656, partial [Oleoguttula sp. CCFEE 5521]